MANAGRLASVGVVSLATTAPAATAMAAAPTAAKDQALRALATLTNALYGSHLTDIETCLKVAPTAHWRKVDLKSNGFGIEAELTDLGPAWRARSRPQHPGGEPGGAVS